MGKRILRKLQRQAARRTAQRRNLLHIKGGNDRDRRLAAALQQGASTLVTRLSASSAGGDRLASTEASGANARSKLTSQTDHSVGAGQGASRLWTSIESGSETLLSFGRPTLFSDLQLYIPPDLHSGRTKPIS